MRKNYFGSFNSNVYIPNRRVLKTQNFL